MMDMFESQQVSATSAQCSAHVSKVHRFNREACCMCVHMDMLMECENLVQESMLKFIHGQVPSARHRGLASKAEYPIAQTNRKLKRKTASE